MASPLLTLQNIALTFGGQPVLEGANLSVGTGGRIALVGRNGSGKSTLLKIAAGIIKPDDGELFVQPGVTWRYLEQEPDLAGFSNVYEYVVDGLGPSHDTHRATYLLEQLSLLPDTPTSNLSGGEARRAALARALAPEPEILLLDEPTNHLDLPAIEWLEQELKSLRSGIVLISHDRSFLNALSKTTVWLDRGQTRQLNLGFSSFEAWRDKHLEEEELAHHKLARKIAAEEHWIRYGVTARRKRNVRRLAQVSELRQQYNDRRAVQGGVNFTVAQGRNTGTIVVDAKDISLTLGDKPLVANLTLRMLRSDRLAIAGPNGAGKTSLIKLLLGELAPDSGEIKRGANIQPAILDQNRAALDPTVTLADALTGGGKDTLVINGQTKHVIAYMKDFLFTPDQMRTPLGKLSGGERARVMLARALALPSNLLVLDEPTNDLDLETLDLLQEMISDYQGTVILVSHDRDFIDRVATSTLIAEGKGQWSEYAGGYSDMVALRGHGVGTAELPKPTTNKTSKKTNKKATSAQPAPPRRQKMSFKQSHALKTLPGQLDKLATRQVELQTKLSAADLYQRDPDGFAKLSQELSEAATEHETLELEWLELEIAREEIENQT